MATPQSTIIGPSSNFYVSQRQRLHYVDWGNESAPLLLLVHGGRDHARSWDWVAKELRGDYHVVAPDLRGHGDSSWSFGGSYSMPAFVLDLVQLLDAVDQFPATIISHSLGGAVSLMYAGVYPDKVAKLVAIEGLGPPPDIMAKIQGVPGWKRLRNWVDQMQELAGRQPRRYPSIDDAARRMLDENPFLDADQAHHLTVHGVARNEDGTYSWKFDNYVRSFSPQRFTDEDTLALRERIECPVLLVRGTESGTVDPVKDGCIESFRDSTSVDIEGAGHWAHHDRFDEFMRIVRGFLKGGSLPATAE